MPFLTRTNLSPFFPSWLARPLSSSVFLGQPENFPGGRQSQDKVRYQQMSCTCQSKGQCVLHLCRPSIVIKTDFEWKIIFHWFMKFWLLYNGDYRFMRRNLTVRPAPVPPDAQALPPFHPHNTTPPLAHLEPLETVSRCFPAEAQRSVRLESWSINGRAAPATLAKTSPT